MLNDPALSAPITPLDDGNGNLQWDDKDAEAIYNDIAQGLYKSSLHSFRAILSARML